MIGFILRDTHTGASLGRGLTYATQADAFAAAKRRVRRASAPVDVWWVNDAGVAKVRLGAVMILDGDLHVTRTGLAADA